MSQTEQIDQYTEYDYLTDEYFRKTYPDVCDILIKAYKVNSKTCLKKFIKKYGEAEGINRYFIWRKKCSRNKEFFIEKYGEVDGLKRYERFKNNSSITLEKYIEKYGEIDGIKKWNELSYKKGSSNRVDFYISKGYSEEEAKNIVYKKQKSASDGRYKNKNIDRTSFEYRCTFNTCLEFYLKRGYSKEEALEQIKERQNTFTLEKCIERHGEKKGIEIYNNRQKKWQETLKSKSIEEKMQIEKKKYNSIAFTSKSSVLFFDKLVDLLKEHNIVFDKIYYGNNEFLYWDDNTKRVYFYDFVIPEIKYVCEYNGIKFHPKENMPKEKQEEWRALYSNKTYEECMSFDKYKNSLMTNNGYVLDIVWEDDDINESYNKIIQNIKKLI